MSTEVVKYEGGEQPIALRHELSVEEVVARIHKVHQAMEKAMVQDHHYGVIPGTKKPTLLKPGAELLNVMFRLDPQYATDTLRDGDHITITSTCTLWHIPTGQRVGSGQGSCSTRESKYAWRESQRLCPECGKPAIVKGKDEYGGGWLCFKKKEGCGAKFKAGDAVIEAQQTGRVPNPDLPDTYNTVLKMANKRSLVAAVLNVTAASDIFTQDLEDIEPAGLPRTEDVDRRGADVHPRGDGGALDKQEAPGPSGQHETIEQEGDRLFQTPEEQEREEKIAVLESIAKGFGMLKMSPDMRLVLWKKHTNHPVFYEAAAFDPDAITLDALNALLGELRALHRAAESRKR